MRPNICRKLYTFEQFSLYLRSIVVDPFPAITPKDMTGLSRNPRSIWFTAGENRAVLPNWPLEENAAGSRLPDSDTVPFL